MPHPPFRVYHHLRQHGLTPRQAWKARCSMHRWMLDDDRVALETVHILDEMSPQPLVAAWFERGFVMIPTSPALRLR